MKNTVYTVITAVLLLATLCLPAAAQTWQRDNWTFGAADDQNDASDIVAIEFRNNNQVFFGKDHRLYKWDLNTRWLWWLNHGFGATVSNVAVPRGDSSVVIYAVDDYLHIRAADNLNISRAVKGFNGTILSLDVDEGGFYAVVTYDESPNASLDIDADIYDIWGPNEWQLRFANTAGFSTPYGDVIMHPTYTYDHNTPRWYSQKNQGDERFSEHTEYWGNKTDSYITSRWDPIDKIAITTRYRSNNNDATRLAALDSGNVIHVWSYTGNHLFTFNRSEGYAAHDDILEFTPNGELLVTAYDHDVRFWDVSQKALDHSFRIPDSHLPSDESIESLAFSDDGKLMAIGGSDGTVHIYEWTGGSAPVAPPKETEPAQPTALLENYPNPFNPETWIPYQLSEAAEVTVTIHASDGKLVRTLELGQVPAGVYSEKDRAAYWDGQNEQGEPVASGVYFYTLKAGEFSATQKMVIRK